MQTYQEFFDNLATRWNSMQSPERITKLQYLLAQFAPLWQNTRTILDVGTGTGALLPLLPNYAPQAKITAMDLSPEMLSRAKSRPGNTPLLQANGQQLPFAANTFSVTVCHAVFPHFPDKPAALLDLRRVLVSGGTLLILHEISREQVNAIHQRVQGPINNDRVPPADEMRSLLVTAGFEEIQVEDATDHYLAVAKKPTTRN